MTNSKKTERTIATIVIIAMAYSILSAAIGFLTDNAGLLQITFAVLCACLVTILASGYYYGFNSNPFK